MKTLTLPLEKPRNVHTLKCDSLSGLGILTQHLGFSDLREDVGELGAHVALQGRRGHVTLYQLRQLLHVTAWLLHDHHVVTST